MRAPIPATPEDRRAVEELRFFATHRVAEWGPETLRSLFAGGGLEFRDVREYQAGDEVRFLDRNVTARTGRPHVKVHDREQRQSVFLVLDVSPRSQSGPAGTTVRDRLRRLAAILLLAASRLGHRTGACFSGSRFANPPVPLGSGEQHALRILRELVVRSDSDQPGSFDHAVELASISLPRGSMLFVLSDFEDQGLEAVLEAAAHHHHVHCIRIAHPLKPLLESRGGWDLADAEGGNRSFVDFGSRKVREAIVQDERTRCDAFLAWARRSGVEACALAEDASPATTLIQFLGEPKRRRGWTQRR